MKRTTRYQAAIIAADQILLLQAIDAQDGQTFWLIPGGGQEPGESEEACVQREAFEETCLRVEVERLILDEPASGDSIYQRRKTYLCRVLEGEAQPGCEPEVDTPEFTTIQQVGWFDLRDPLSWNELVRSDPITYPLLQRIRAALGYTTD
ncbi:MAG TPA: NUDIX hydrolase [Herpetosiphonaceae bacterium]